jgi:hypothetical protein
MRTREELDEWQKALRSMFEQKQIDGPGYYMGLVVVAEEHARNGDTNSVLEVLSDVPLDYFDKDHQRQMSENPDFAASATFLAQKLVEWGYMRPALATLKPTQPQAKA